MRRAASVAGGRLPPRTGPISTPKLRPRDLGAQNLKLVAQHQQVDVLQVQATATPNECAEQSPKRDVEEGKEPAADPPKPSPRRSAT